MALFVIVLPFSLAQVSPVSEGAYWKSVPVKYSWDLSMSHLCLKDDQCLVHPLGNPDFDGDVARWFSTDNVQNLPKCVNNSQFVLDYYCEAGNWSTRTKHLAFYLRAHAAAVSNDQFVLFCDSYERVLNQYGYLVRGIVVEDYFKESCTVGSKNVPCVNSLCVLKTADNVAVGAAINIPINDPGKSFLLALDKDPSLCNNVDPSGVAFASCGENVWYHPFLKLVIYSPGGLQRGEVPRDWLRGPFGAINDYVMSTLHKPASGMNFAFFPKTSLFNHVYLAQSGQKMLFGFLETKIRPDNNPVPLDYFGIRYSNINLGPDPCLEYIKRYDSRAFCEAREEEPEEGFMVVARHRPGLGESPIVSAWPALAGKLRP